MYIFNDFSHEVNFINLKSNSKENEKGKKIEWKIHRFNVLWKRHIKI